jgi:gliding motility-associated lipoprotein GldH
MSSGRKQAFYLVLALAGCCVSCVGDSSVISESSPIANKTWQAGQIMDFEFESNDTLQLYQLYVTLRNTTDYPYSNLFLFLDIEFPDKRAYRDTIECVLARKDGQWTGKGFGKIIENQFLFRDDVWFPVPGKYTFRLQHGMREDYLEGIADVGIRIVKK